MNSSMESAPSPLVVFESDHIDTSRAEMLVLCLSEKIKEKRFKLQNLITSNEEKKRCNELMENEKTQLTAKLASIEHENSVHEQQLQSEQLRIKELQFNIQLLNDHNNSIKRDCINEERNYEQEKSTLIGKFERTKQQWTDIFKPQYEQSKVYQYLKKGDIAYNELIERRDTLLNSQKLAYKNYLKRCQEYCNEKTCRPLVLSIAKYFIFRRDQLIKIQVMKEKLIELENKQKQLLENKVDKMKAWESVYNQPVKRDLMDFCLQTNIEQALTLSFSQLQQDSFLQPMTPVTVAAVIPQQDEQVELSPTQTTNIKSSVTFQSSIPIIDNEFIHQTATTSTNDIPTTSSIASTIVIVPNMTNDVPVSSHRSSILHLTTAIEDDDDQLFSKRYRKIPTVQMEQMTLNDFQQSTQAFSVSTTSDNSAIEVDQEISSMSQNNQPITQEFTVAPICTTLETTPEQDLAAPTMNSEMSESISMLCIDSTQNKLHPTVTFQLPPPRTHSRPIISAVSSIQPQVTSNDVQQMLLNFSPDSPSTNEQQLQAMETDSEQLQEQEQRPVFLMPSSVESVTSIEDGFNSFNYNFGFNCNTPNGSNIGGKDFTSPINFGNWTGIASPIRSDSNDQFSAFLQQANNNAQNSVDTSFSFASFNYGGEGIEASVDGAFGSFFFSSNDSNMNIDQPPDGK